MTRRVNLVEAERFMRSYDHGQLDATTTAKLYKVPAGRTLRVTRVTYVNATGLAADGTNAFALDVKNNTTVVAAVFNTDSGDTGGAALTAGAWVDGVLNATDASRVLAAGDTLSAVFTEDGTATLPAGTLIIEGLLL